MNAAKFVVILFIGIVCANVGARQLEEVPKEAKTGISIPETATTNGVGTQLYVAIGNSGYGGGSSSSKADNGRGGSRGSTSAGGSGSGNGYIVAEGTNADAYLDSYGTGQGDTRAEVGDGGATTSGTGYGAGGSFGGGSSSP